MSNLSERDIQVLDDPTVKAWLNEFIKASTRHAYSHGICVFFKSLNILPSDLQKLDQKEIKQLILTVQKKMKDNNATNSHVRLIVATIRSYLASQDIQIMFRRNQLVKTQADNSSHIYSNGDLCRMFEVGGAFEKALLATACSQGWEISMFLEQKRKKMEQRIEHAKQNNEQFIFFMDRREKTGEPRFCVLNPLAIESLSNYFAVRTDDDEQLFPIKHSGVQKLLYRLAKDANLKTTGALRFHNIRKWLMSRLSRCGFNEFQIKFVMGKRIGLSDATYLQTLQSEIEEKYPVVYNDYLNICWKPSVGGALVFSPSEISLLRSIMAAVKEGKLNLGL